MELAQFECIAQCDPLIVLRRTDVLALLVTYLRFSFFSIIHIT